MAAIAWPPSPSVGDTVSSDDGAVTFICTQVSPDEVWDVKETDKVIYGQPIGSVHWCPYENPYPGCLMLNATRQEISRTTYADLWSWISTNAGSALAASEAAAEDGQFGPGDGSTTFTLPSAADYFLRVASASNPLGSTLEDAFQGHSHELAFTSSSATTSGGSSFYAWNSDVTGAGDAIDDLGEAFIRSPTSDGVNGAPRTAGETRPKFIGWNVCIVAFHTVDDSAQVSAAQVVADLAALGGSVASLQSSVLWNYATPQDTTSGTEFDFVVPAGASEIELVIVNVSLDGTDDLLVQIGDSGGIDVSGYKGGSGRASSSSSSSSLSSGFQAQAASAAADLTGAFKLSRLTEDGLTWVCEGVFGRSSAYMPVVSGVKTLSGELTQVRLTNDGADIFDGGKVYLKYR